jgi:hypothetical protein
MAVYPGGGDHRKGESMAELVVEKEGPELFGFHLQRKEGDKHKQESLRFNKDGKVTKQLPKGTYALGWALVGSAGDKWKYVVTLAGKALEKNDGTLTQETRSEGGAILVEVTA